MKPFSPPSKAIWATTFHTSFPLCPQSNKASALLLGKNRGFEAVEQYSSPHPSLQVRYAIPHLTWDFPCYSSGEALSDSPVRLINPKYLRRKIQNLAIFQLVRGVMAETSDAQLSKETICTFECNGTTSLPPIRFRIIANEKTESLEITAESESH